MLKDSKSGVMDDGMDGTMVSVGRRNMGESLSFLGDQEVKSKNGHNVLSCREYV